MVKYLLLGVALLVAVLLIARWFESANPSRLAKALKWGFLGLGAVVAIFLGVTGKPWFVKTFKSVVPPELSDAQSTELATLNGEIAELRKERSKVLLTTVDWTMIWVIPAVFAGAIMLIFAFVFKEDRSTKGNDDPAETVDA